MAAAAYLTLIMQENMVVYFKIAKLVTLSYARDVTYQR